MAIRDFSQSLPMLLYRALDEVMPRFRRIFNDAGITEQQWRVLRVLLDEPELSLRELAELTVIAPPSLVGVVDRLEKAGLVQRRRADDDRRRVTITASDTGRALQHRLAPVVAATYAELMQSLPPREWLSLVEGLKKLTGADGVTPSATLASGPRNGESK